MESRHLSKHLLMVVFSAYLVESEVGLVEGHFLGEFSVGFLEAGDEVGVRFAAANALDSNSVVLVDELVDFLYLGVVKLL